MWCLVWVFLAAIRAWLGRRCQILDTIAAVVSQLEEKLNKKPFWGESVRFNWGFNFVFCALAVKSKCYTDSFGWLSALIMLLRPHSSSGITHSLVGFSGISALEQCKDTAIPAAQRQCCTYVTDFLHLFTQTSCRHGDLQDLASWHQFHQLPVNTNIAKINYTTLQPTGPGSWLVSLSCLKITSWPSKTTLWRHFCSEKGQTVTDVSECANVCWWVTTFLGALKLHIPSQCKSKDSYYVFFCKEKKKTLLNWKQQESTAWINHEVVVSFLG